MRYFVRCMYKGTSYQGWQRQPHTSLTIQQQIEDAIQLVTRVPTEVVGCGRTDSGVHAKEYVFHFDTEYENINNLIYKINQITPNDILCASWRRVSPKGHARYSAIKRGYVYHLHKEKNPFYLETAYHHVNWPEVDIDLMNKSACMLLGTHDFEAFCKTGTDVKTKICTITTSRWSLTEHGMIYTVRADRYLRGMIRLIVGMCLNVSRGKVSLVEVQDALQQKTRLAHDWSVPAQGLFLDLVEYPTEVFRS